MEIALPHVVVRICGPGVGPELVAALDLHPLEISQARDASEARRVARGRRAVLVVVTDPTDARAAIAETWSEFPRTPIVLVAHTVADATHLAIASPGSVSEKGWVDSISGGLPLAEICWHVLEAVGRAAMLESGADHPIGPVLLEVDEAGCVTSVARAEGLLVDGRRVGPGASLLNVVAPADRAPFAQALGRMQPGEIRFAPLRILDMRGGSHAASMAMRCVEAGRYAMVVQPLLSGGPIVGRHVNNRDPITGLLTRWAVASTLESLARSDPEGRGLVLLVLKLDNFAAISEYIGHEATDAVLVRVASVMSGVLAYPAVCSRVMGDTFLACLPGGGIDAVVHAAELLIRGVNEIDVPGFSGGFHIRASAGVAAASRRDYDLALRLADAAATEARAAGGDRAIVAQTPVATAVARDLAAAMDVGAWEVWLQPVAAEPGGHAVFHEALARFGNGCGRVISRPDFFALGRAQGLLERFDRMMLQRVIELLAAHPEAKISVNVSLESFMSDAFPGSYLDPLRTIPNGHARLILEIPPHGLAMPAAGVRSRLEALAAAGVAVATDDFGSGICQLQDLARYPLAIVKLDELVTGYVDDDPLQREFVRTVVDVCRARGIMTVAEYTRSPEQWKRLVCDGVDWFQGELLGMPAPAAVVLATPPVAGGIALEPAASA